MERLEALCCGICMTELPLCGSCGKQPSGSPGAGAIPVLFPVEVPVS